MKKMLKNLLPGATWEMLSLEEALPSLEEGTLPTPSIENLSCILHKCREEKSIAYALRLHAYMRASGLESNTSLGNELVPILVEVGCMCNAQQVFDTLIYQNDCSWNSLIIGYVKWGDPQRALILYHKMQENNVIHPSLYTFVALLKACAKLKDVKRGDIIHAEITRKGLERSIFVGNMLVDMYAKCGLVAKAQDVFDKLPVRDVVSWTALISGYTQHGQGVEALNCFEKMQVEGVSPNVVTFICCLKACGTIGATDKGQALHAEIARKGLLERNVVVGNTLVDMYAKCGLLAKAQEVFDKLPTRNVVSWNALMTGYAKHGHGEAALNCYEQMQLEGISPNSVTFVCSLKACGSIRAKNSGEEIHSEIARKGLLERDLAVGNALVDMYVNCGLLAKAQEVFDKLPDQDVVSWTSLIAGYAKHGCGEEALDCFERMQLEGISPNAITFVCVLKACGSIGAKDKGQEIHAEISRKGLLESDLDIGNALVDMYAKCGLLVKAQDVFDKLPVRDVVSWNALIAGYADDGCGEEALNCFEQMEHESISPDAVTFVSSLKACGSIGTTAKGQEIHAEISRRGLLERDLVVGNALVDMYAKCGLLAKAQEVFNKLPVRDVVSWNVLIAGYTKHGCGEEALNRFQQMQLEGISPDAVTFACSLKACGSVGANERGFEIQVEIVRKGLLERDPVVGNALVDMYANCGLLAKAQEVFDKLPVRDVVSWTAIISGYANHGHGEEAVKYFEQMHVDGVSPDAVTFACSLKACGSIGARDKGQEIHAEIAREGLMERDLIVGNAVVDMYVNCGLLAKAQEVFDKLPVRDVVSWNALIAGYAQLGESENVFHILDRMRGENIRPNLVTFVSILNACSHAGLVDEGQMYFEAMSNDYSFTPTLKHYICMVDLLCRAGQLDKAVVMIKSKPFHPNLVTWNIILGACQKWGEMELGKEAFEHAMRLDEKDAATYVCMSNIYADADM